MTAGRSEEKAPLKRDNDPKKGGKPSQEMNQRMSAVMQDPSNQVCADCPAVRPLWASFLHSPGGPKVMGVLLCSGCAQHHHFTLGDKRCYIQYLKMAHEWKLEDVLLLEATGNAAVNRVLEARLTPEDFFKDLIVEKEDEEEARRSKFIKHKYKKHKYATTDAELVRRLLEEHDPIEEQRQAEKQQVQQRQAEASPPSQSPASRPKERCRRGSRSQKSLHASCPVVSLDDEDLLEAQKEKVDERRHSKSPKRGLDERRHSSKSPRRVLEKQTLSRRGSRRSLLLDSSSNSLNENSAQEQRAAKRAPPSKMILLADLQPKDRSGLLSRRNSRRSLVVAGPSSGKDNADLEEEDTNKYTTKRESGLSRRNSRRSLLANQNKSERGSRRSLLANQNCKSERGSRRSLMEKAKHSKSERGSRRSLLANQNKSERGSRRSLLAGKAKDSTKSERGSRRSLMEKAKHSKSERSSRRSDLGSQKSCPNLKVDNLKDNEEKKGEDGNNKREMQLAQIKSRNLGTSTIRNKVSKSPKREPSSLTRRNIAGLPDNKSKRAGRRALLQSQMSCPNLGLEKEQEPEVLFGKRRSTGNLLDESQEDSCPDKDSQEKGKLPKPSLGSERKMRTLQHRKKRGSTRSGPSSTDLQKSCPNLTFDPNELLEEEEPPTKQDKKKETLPPRRKSRPSLQTQTSCPNLIRLANADEQDASKDSAAGEEQQQASSSAKTTKEDKEKRPSMRCNRSANSFSVTAGGQQQQQLSSPSKSRKTTRTSSLLDPSAGEQQPPASPSKDTVRRRKSANSLSLLASKQLSPSKSQQVMRRAMQSTRRNKSSSNLLAGEPQEGEDSKPTETTTAPLKRSGTKNKIQRSGSKSNLLAGEPQQGESPKPTETAAAPLKRSGSRNRIHRSGSRNRMQRSGSSKLHQSSPNLFADLSSSSLVQPSNNKKNAAWEKRMQRYGSSKLHQSSPNLFADFSSSSLAQPSNNKKNATWEKSSKNKLQSLADDFVRTSLLDVTRKQLVASASSGDNSAITPKRSGSCTKLDRMVVPDWTE